MIILYLTECHIWSPVVVPLLSVEVVAPPGPDWSSSPHGVEVVVPPGPDWDSSPHGVEVVVPPGPDWNSSPLYTQTEGGEKRQRQHNNSKCCFSLDEIYSPIHCIVWSQRCLCIVSVFSTT